MCIASHGIMVRAYSMWWGNLQSVSIFGQAQFVPEGCFPQTIPMPDVMSDVAGTAAQQSFLCKDFKPPFCSDWLSYGELNCTADH